MKDQTYFREISAKPVMKVPPFLFLSLSSYTIVQKSGNSIFPKDTPPPHPYFRGNGIVRGGVGCPTVQSFPHGTPGKKERGWGGEDICTNRPYFSFPIQGCCFRAQKIGKRKKKKKGRMGGGGAKKLRQIISTFAVFFGGFLSGTE